MHNQNSTLAREGDFDRGVSVFQQHGSVFTLLMLVCPPDVVGVVR